MSVTDYVVDILLILVIFRAVRPHPLTPLAALLPLLLLAIAGIIYLGPLTLRGNDLALILVLAAAGALLGVLSGLADRIWQDQGRQLLSRAVALSVVAWVAGMVTR
jgi:FtsH-binding integral membrane protein